MGASKRKKPTERPNDSESLITGTVDAYLPTATGELVHRELNVSNRPKRKPRLKPDTWSQLMQEGFQLLSQMSLTQHETRILHYLIAKSEYANIVRLSQSVIGRDLGIQQSHVSRAVSSLTASGIVFKERDDKGNYLRVSSVLVWKGTPDVNFRKLYKADSECLTLEKCKHLPEIADEVGPIGPTCSLIAS